MRKIVLLFLFVIGLFPITLVAQDHKTESSGVLKNQADLYNEVYASYGAGSILFFIKRHTEYSYLSPGGFMLGYSRHMNKVISVGFVASYTPISYSNPKSTFKHTDNYLQGIANVRFSYLNKPVFRMYSGIGIGITMNYYSETNNGVTTNAQKLLPAGQLTLLGFRVGRSFSGFGEFGVGTNGIIILGVSYKFGQ